MSPPPASTIAQLFAAALACEPAERAAFLDRACRDRELRREIESLLEADAQADGFLEPPDRTGSAPADHLGPYRLLHKISEGDLSNVYLAARDDGQYRQEVAIKLVRPSAMSAPAEQRLRQERQILASLVHPNIVRLLDGGTTAAGQPYLTMEYVAGEPLDVHCRARGLSLSHRLELFIAICLAVQFAHSSGVVHRDLKPGNIMVGTDGVPKLLDFGIAKLLDPAQLGVRVEPITSAAGVMTPNYASPEQVMGVPISTRSDIYSLGVILYELITGSRPYDLESKSLPEIERIVCKAAPPMPSQIVRAARQPRLPGDLDNIVLMAMHKAPERRYASAQALADDVRRCLANRPVLARRDTWSYRASVFTRRNAAAVVTGLAIALLALGGTIATRWEWQQAVTERTRAATEWREAERTLEILLEQARASTPPCQAR